MVSRFRHFLLGLSLTIALATGAVFGLGTASSWAAPKAIAPTLQPQTQLMALWGKGKAKELEGNAQEAVGNLTGDPKDQMAGKAKQLQGKATTAVEEAKDNLQLQGRAKAISKNVEGKAQAAIGDTTGNLGDQIAGSAKQLESQVRNTIEDAKDLLN